MPYRVGPHASGQSAILDGGLEAFVPNALPPTISWTDALATELAGAQGAIGNVIGASKRLEGVDRLARSFVRSEAVASSRIEGTQATTSDLALFEAGKSDTSSDTAEVHNYLQAFDFVMDAEIDRPVSLSFVREIHALLMAGNRNMVEHAGRFRDSQVFIGARTRRIEDAGLVPPPPLRMLDGMDTWIQFAQQKSSVPLLVRHALLHYQFECIHPFVDGNGRVGRLLIAYFMRVDGMLEKPLFALNAYFERNRPEYYARLNAVSQKSEWTEWLMYYLTGIETQGYQAVERI